MPLPSTFGHYTTQQYLQRLNKLSNETKPQ